MDERRPFFEHLRELRERLIRSLVAIGIAFVITYAFKEELFSFLMQPFLKVMPKGSSFIFTSVTEAFLTYFKVALVSALFLASPVILYEIWMFVSPGLYERERRFLYPFIVFGTISFVAGALFCYFVAMPSVFRFFMSFAAPFIVPMPALRPYVNLVLKMVLIFGIVFELPLACFYLSRAGIIDFRMLSKKRGHAVVSIFILSALLTPPDVVSQILLALPMWGLFELGILIAKRFGKKEERDGL